MRHVVSLFALALVLLNGCTGVAARPTLEGSAWQLSGWAETGLDAGTYKITAAFADGRMAGKAAVNNYFAAYTEGPDNRFTVSEAGSTMMAGLPAAMDAEQAYLRLLEQVKTFNRTADALTLADADGKALLVFAPITAD